MQYPTASAGEDFSITCTDYLSGRSLMGKWECKWGIQFFMDKRSDKVKVTNAWAITVVVILYLDAPSNDGTV